MSNGRLSAFALLREEGGTLVIPLTLQDIETDAAELVDVGVEDLCEESNLGRSHGVVVG